MNCNIISVWLVKYSYQDCMLSGTPCFLLFVGHVNGPLGWHRDLFIIRLLVAKLPVNFDRSVVRSMLA